jgi:hypothetical protein
VSTPTGALTCGNAEHAGHGTGIGVDTASWLLVAAGDNPQRLRSEATWAHLCGASPIHASTGNTIRLRLNRSGDRQANHALWRIAITRMRNDARTRDYVARRLAEGKTKKEIIRMRNDARTRDYVARRRAEGKTKK